MIISRLTCSHLTRSTTTPFRLLSVMQETTISPSLAAAAKRKAEDSPEEDTEAAKKKKQWLTEKRRQKKEKNRQAVIHGLDPANSNTSYYFDGYTRNVYPYYHLYKNYVKERWMGRKLAEVLTAEFRTLPPDRLAAKIKSGAIRVNGKIVHQDYILSGHEHMTHYAHRHELPVLASKIEFIHEDDKYLVVNKPPSIPVHSVGRYGFNCILSILSTEHNYKSLFSCHRLDRLTSGVLILGKTSDAANEVHKLIEQHKAKKEYLCRVVGDFPDTSDDELLVDQPLERLCPKTGAMFIASSGKSSKTSFKKISFNGKSSLVRCTPLTGRTHQIRVHLQYLGYPILNDPLYNSTAFGPGKGKDGNYAGMDREQVLKSIQKDHLIDDWIILESNDNETDESNADHMGNTIAYFGQDVVDREPKFDPNKLVIDPTCEECDIRYKPLKPKHMMMFLHAIKYSGPDWRYETKLPFWAEDNYDLL